MPAPDSNANIARHLGLMAVAQPGRAALKVPRGRNRSGDIDYLSLTFADLDAEVAAWATRLLTAGVTRGDRTLVMVRQGLPLIASVFALFRVGAVPIVIDPGMGLKSFLNCVARSRPRALLGIPFALLISRIFRAPFRSVFARIAASSSLTARLAPSAVDHRQLAIAEVPSAPDELAAVLFTSGSTGSPKGVCYEHGMFDAQIRLIRDAYRIEPGEIDLPLLPIFALFNPALGMTTIVPEIDPRRPAALDPARIVQAIRQENVTNSFGSPTLWRKLGDHCRAHHLTLPSLRRVLCAGAAVPAALWESSRAFLPNGQLHSPYGATEALPIATISSAEIAALTTAPAESLPAATAAAPASAATPEPNVIRYTPLCGACVGRPLPGIDVKIIAITDAPLATLADARELLPGDIGEIIVRGPNVTRAYDALPEATALAKIQTPNTKVQRAATAPMDGGAFGVCDLAPEISAPPGAVWHRTGDCGYLDPAGRLWFCGRKAERVETLLGTLHTEPCEQVFRRHPRATRCALIGLGERDRQRAGLVVETRVKNTSDARALARELREFALQHEQTATIKLFYFREKFPVDVRHNAKIHRLALARWAATAVGFESDPKR